MDEHRTIKGRGATRNPKSRYLNTTTVPVDDGWSLDPQLEEEFSASSPNSEFLPDKTRNIITKNSSPDVPFDQSINPYKGCEHGCVYCFARPTHAYLDLSPGLDFETKIFYKTNPVERLREALDNPRYQCKPIAMGTNTDPYQPVERKLRVTRQILETLLEYQHPVSIVTKGVLIQRDFDLLTEFAKLDLVSVAISVTTLQNELKTKLEPRTASPSARLRLVESLAKLDISVGVMVAPIIPMLNDHELEEIVKRSASAGAQFAGYVMIRLPLEVAPLFETWLDDHYPMKSSRVMNRIRDLHDGKAYDSQWGVRMRGTGPYAELINKRFEIIKRKCGLPPYLGAGSEIEIKTHERTDSRVNPNNLFVSAERTEPLRTDLFRRPGRASVVYITLVPFVVFWNKRRRECSNAL